MLSIEYSVLPVFIFQAPIFGVNLQQLEYIVALDIYRNHVKAATHCNVTQPTLSSSVPFRPEPASP
jgi:hypothetical protein